MEKIDTNINIAQKEFIDITKNLTKECLYYIQFKGVILENDFIYFNFKSSQNSINFKVYGGVNINDIYLTLKGKTNYIYTFFEQIKNNI